MTLTIGHIPVGGDHPCRFVAEVSNAHNGDLARAHRLIDAIATTGAEFVKVQAYTPSELVALRGDGPAPDPWGAQGWTMRTLYEKARTPLEWLPELFQHARDVGLVPFSSVFGLTSLAALKAVDCPAYKVARLDNRHEALAAAVMSTEKTVMVSEDMGDVMAWRYTDVITLLCPAGYPAVVRGLPRFWPTSHYLGLSSHCLAPELPIAAVARGCKLIEMHVQLDDEPSELEANVSLTITQFRRMVEAVRATETLLG